MTENEYEDFDYHNSMRPAGSVRRGQRRLPTIGQYACDQRTASRSRECERPATTLHTRADDASCGPKCDCADACSCARSCAGSPGQSFAEAGILRFVGIAANHRIIAACRAAGVRAAVVPVR